MVLNRLRYSIEAEDNTGQAVASAQGRFSRFFNETSEQAGEVGDALAEGLDVDDADLDVPEQRVSNVFSRMAVAAAGVGLALAGGVIEASNRATDALRRLEIELGGGTEESREFFGRLLEQGFDPENATAAVATLAGQGRQLGIEADDPTLGATFAAVANVGGDPSQTARALTAFGVRGPQNVAANIQLAFAEGASRNVAPEAVFGALQVYGPPLATLGLNFLEAAAFIVDLLSSGVDVSRVAPALNRLGREGSLAGESPRLAVTDLFDRIEGAATREEALAIATPDFGAEGAQRLVTGVRQGGVNLREALTLDPSILQNESLLSVGLPGVEDLVRNQLLGVSTDPDLARRTVGQGFSGVASGIGELPLVGDLGEGFILRGLDLINRANPSGGIFGETDVRDFQGITGRPGSQALLLFREQNERLAGAIEELNRQLGNQRAIDSIVRIPGPNVDPGRGNPTPTPQQQIEARVGAFF